MIKPWTDIMSKQEMIEYLRVYLKQRGYKQQKQTWHRINQDRVYVIVNVQNSQWDRETYYINLGAGAETGIYKKGIGDHYFTATDLAQKMQLNLKDSSNNTIFNYAPTEKQWWINGFNPNYQGVQAKDLKSTTTIQFSDSKEDQDLYNTLLKNKIKNKEKYKEWNFDEKTKTAILEW